jgi:predicted Fe-Mo cluster-binding NifX family protein
MVRTSGSTMAEKILITIWRSEVAPRFDLTSEVLILSLNPDGSIGQRKSVVLPTVSAEDLCHMILIEAITVVICGAIEEEYYQYLTWKKIKVIDSVIAPYEGALELALQGNLQPGANLLRQSAVDGI